MGDGLEQDQYIFLRCDLESRLGCGTDTSGDGHCCSFFFWLKLKCHGTGG